MEANYAYHGATTVASTAERSRLSFAPDTLRPPTWFRGELKQGLAFREAISALHDVVVSDLRFRPKERAAYKQWAARREEAELAAMAAQQHDVARRVEELRAEIDQLRQRGEERWRPFFAARKRYFDYLYSKQRDWWFLLDPVITVHPDELFFECFSRDESSYGRLGVGYDVFQNVDEFACGTTNIDYSSALYEEFQKIRSYKTTRLEVDPTGFQVRTGSDEALREVKIDLPDSWVRGFLQVASAMTLPAARFDLHPLDVHNLCFWLRRRKEKHGPRALRYVLRPGAPARVVIEPWDLEVVCPRSRYDGAFAGEIRVWGRRRLHVLERLIPVARKFTVHLLGHGMPSFYVADLGPLSFTLGLSGWTANDWASRGNFDLLAPRGQVDLVTKTRVFDALRAEWSLTPEALAARLGVDRAAVLGALGAYAQAGRAMYDLNKRVWRARELSREPLPLEQLQFSNSREGAAVRLLEAGGARIRSAEYNEQRALTLTGQVREGGRSHLVTLTLDRDERLADARCDCPWHRANALRQGPCEHVLALRLQHVRLERGGAFSQN